MPFLERRVARLGAAAAAAVVVDDLGAHEHWLVDRIVREARLRT